jgi:hypothetical protein
MVLGAGCGGESESPPANNNQPPADSTPPQSPTDNTPPQPPTDNTPPPPAEIPENPASDFEYRTITGGIEITGYRGSAIEVRIPSVIEGAHVVTINGAFQNRSAITAVIIPDSVTSIGERAFLGCTGLTSIRLPDSLTSIGERAFENTGLTSITLPDGLINIGSRAFHRTAWFNSQPEGVVYIGNIAYSYKDALDSEGDDRIPTEEEAARRREGISVVLRDDTIAIADGAFAGRNLKSITLPHGLLHIGNNAFIRTWLTNISIPDSVTSIGTGVFEGAYYRGSGFDSIVHLTATYRGKTYDNLTWRRADSIRIEDLPREFYDAVNGR